MSSLLPTRLALDNYFPPAPPVPSGQADPGQPEVKPAAAAVSPPAGIKIPANGDDLTEMSQEQYNLDQSAAATLGFSAFSLSASGQHDVLVFQVARYKDVASGDDTFRFGVAIEAVITVSVEKFEGNLTLPGVAANVQLNNSSASSDLAIRGYLPQTKLQLPPWGSFDVGSYATFQSTVSALQDLILFDSANIRPVLLATTRPAPGSAPAQKAPHGFFYNAGKRIEEIVLVPRERKVRNEEPVARQGWFQRLVSPRSRRE